MTETEKWINESLKSLPHLCAEIRRLSEENDALRSRFAATPPNDPLTEAELRAMDGEPVYLDFGDGGEWVLVRMMENDVCFSHKNTICAPAKIAFECGAKVYRRKPEASSDAE